MRIALLSCLLALAAACGDDPKGQSQCDNVVPAPAACMTQCDPAPGAPSTCPGGYHCSPDGTCDAFCTASGGECGDGYRCTPDGRCVGNDECVGLECNIVNCDAMGMPPTTVSGTVYAPNGSLPLYGINVYVPNTAVAPPPEGAVCDRCSDSIPGYPLSKVVTDEAGKFVLSGVPSGTNVPVMIQSGKWRRQITIPTVAPCADTTLPAAETRLPKNKAEGNLPKIAITTGNADSIECLVRKLGIDDAEINKQGTDGRIHIYAGNGADEFRSGFPGGNGQMPDAQDFWSDVNSLRTYDIVILSCEGAQNPNTKPQAALDAMKAYADLGGRVFASHWHNIWIGGAFESGGNPSQPVWEPIANWANSGNPPDPTNATIDEMMNPKGSSFATWMLNVMGSTTRGIVPVAEGRITSTTIDPLKAERWVYLTSQQGGGTEGVQNFQFTTPNERPPGDRCGKVVFSDMHVSADSASSSGTPYPQQCSTSPLTPQEKALAFMFFDIASCVAGPIL